MSEVALGTMSQVRLELQGLAVLALAQGAIQPPRDSFIIQRMPDLLR